MNPAPITTAMITGAFTQPLVVLTRTLPPSAGNNSPTVVNVATAPAAARPQPISLRRWITVDTSVFVIGL